MSIKLERMLREELQINICGILSNFHIFVFCPVGFLYSRLLVIWGVMKTVMLNQEH